MRREDVFPKFSDGFYADVRIIGYHLRLFAHTSEASWVSSVYSVPLRMWICKDRLAGNAQQAKTEAEDIARQELPGKYPIEWRAVAA